MFYNNYNIFKGLVDMSEITVLIVDDESRMRKLIKDFLVQKAYKILEACDGEEAIKVFKAIVLMSYGVRTDDGRFVKNQEIRDKFTQSAAYSEIFMELATDTDKAQKFINGILPNMGNAIPAPPLPNKHNN